MPMSAKEVEAGLSLLHMMQPPSSEVSSRSYVRVRVRALLRTS